MMTLKNKPSKITSLLYTEAVVADKKIETQNGQLSIHACQDEWWKTYSTTFGDTHTYIRFQAYREYDPFSIESWISYSLRMERWPDLFLMNMEMPQRFEQ